MMRVIIDVVTNGWIVQTAGDSSGPSVFNVQKDLMVEVYRRTCEQHPHLKNEPEVEP